MITHTTFKVLNDKNSNIFSIEQHEEETLFKSILDKINLIGDPLKFSKTLASYRLSTAKFQRLIQENCLKKLKKSRIASDNVNPKIAQVTSDWLLAEVISLSATIVRAATKLDQEPAQLSQPAPAPTCGTRDGAAKLVYLSGIGCIWNWNVCTISLAIFFAVSRLNVSQGHFL